MNPKDSVGAKKAPLRYVPPALTLEVASVMHNGANKYGAFNWREQPVSAMTYVEAMLRHLYAWMDGQDDAEDSGLSHIAHVAASAGILLDAKANDSLIDDRSVGPAPDILRALDKSTPPVELCVCHSPGIPVGQMHVEATRVDGSFTVESIQKVADELLDVSGLDRNITEALAPNTGTPRFVIEEEWGTGEGTITEFTDPDCPNPISCPVC